MRVYNPGPAAWHDADPACHYFEYNGRLTLRAAPCSTQAGTQPASALPYQNCMLAGQHAASGSAQNLPALDVDALVLAAVQRLVGADAGPHTPLMQAGMDSLAALELRNELSRCALVCVYLLKMNCLRHIPMLQEMQACQV